MESNTNRKNSVEGVKSVVEDIQEKVTDECRSIGQLSSYSYTTSSTTISKIISCINQLKESIDMIFTNYSVKLQEEYSWLVLHSCKLIYDIGQPLIWLKCGSYIINSFIYAAISIESIINLNTAKYLKLRMKLLISSFYICVTDETQSSLDQASSIILYSTKQIRDMKEREEFDLPIPVNISSSIYESEMDLAVLRACISFQKNADSFNFNSSMEEAYNAPKIDGNSNSDECNLNLQSKSFYDRVICECCRIQQISSWNKSNTWKKRTALLIDAVYKRISTKNYDGCVSIDTLFEISSLLVLEDVPLITSDRSTILSTIEANTVKCNDINQNSSTMRKSLNLLFLLNNLYKM